MFCNSFRELNADSFLQVITGQTAVQRCNATVNFFEDKRPFYPATINDGKLHEHFRQVAGDMLGENNVNEVKPMTGAEDFSFYQEVIPGYFFFLGMADASLGRLESLHSPNFRVNEDVLPYGAALHASLATSYLLKIQQRVKVAEGKGHDEL